MRRIRLLAALAFVVSVPSAYADSISTLDVNITYASALMGSDGSMGFTL